MFGRRIEIFKVFGFPIRIDLSWLFILLLVTYSLAAGFFPANHPGLPNTAYWAMGFVAAIGLFASVLFHELSHSLVARHFQIPIDGITLFIFGGVAEMREESKSPKEEFLVAVVGPIASIALAAGFLYLSRLGGAQEWNRPLVLIFFYLGLMNGILGIFNLVPAFPLDGGRVFRSILWAIRKDYFWATKIAAIAGQGFAWLLIAWGAVNVLRGSPMDGIWLVLIGFFLKQASARSRQALKIQKELEPIPVTDLLDTNPPSFEEQDRLVDVLSRLEDRRIHTQYPILKNGHLVGFLPILKINGLREEGWEYRHVSDFIETDVDGVVLGAEANAWQAFQKMRSGGLSSLFVVAASQKLQGWVTMERLLSRLNLLGKS